MDLSLALRKQFSLAVGRRKLHFHFTKGKTVKSPFLLLCAHIFSRIIPPFLPHYRHQSFVSGAGSSLPMLNIIYSTNFLIQYMMFLLIFPAIFFHSKWLIGSSAPSFFIRSASSWWKGANEGKKGKGNTWSSSGGNWLFRGTMLRASFLSLFRRFFFLFILQPPVDGWNIVARRMIVQLYCFIKLP